MFNPLIKKYADVLVDYSTSVKKNDLVIIYARGYEAQPLVKEIYKACLIKGANPIVRTSMDELAETFIKYASDEQLEYIDEMTKQEVELADVMIFIGAPSNIKNMANADAQKLAKRSNATRPVLSRRLERSAKNEMRWVIADYPTNALAQEANMSLEEYSEFLINACYLDLENPVQKWIEIDNEQKRLAEILNKYSTYRFVGEKTDVTFSTSGRTWVPCSGNMNFPDGEIFTSPVEDSANGKIYFDFPQNYHGSTSKEVYIELVDGKVVNASAEVGNDFLQSMLNMDSGSRFVGEIAIGTNERVQDVTGNILFDEKIGGSIHVAFGASYPEAGGKNQSGLHWDMIKNMKNGGEIYADGNLIYQNGKFII
ncbi:MAG: aminopeptidase [Candidatus Gastranaerophilales bacterium]|nr:aminopeptidase [Candidatus Gastranaerophilales bacterium]